tara:strand:+ start:1016 stop:1789 length:774 start_codon:yes stop_codon:yes gene_type:complete
LTQDLSILSNLGSKLATLKIREAIRKISIGKRSAYGGGADVALANTLKAEAVSNYAASRNLEDALAALQVAQTSLDEIAALNQRLAELGALNTNNSLLSTEDTAALNQETASITTAIDNIVANTKYNNISLLGTSDVSLNVGASPNGSNQLTITIGGISSIASVTSASNATSTSNTLKSSLGTDQGQVSGATAAARARKNVTSTASAILDAAAETKISVDLASETAKLTKNVLLNKVSLSLSAQANNIQSNKLKLLG